MRLILAFGMVVEPSKAEKISEPGLDPDVPAAVGGRRRRSAAMIHTETRLLLVTGCGRSGTKYISFVLRRLGLDVPHERLGRDGASAWTLAGPPAGRPYGPPGTPRFEHVFHQVRHPLDVIDSASTFGPESWEYICANTTCSSSEPMLVRTARYWLTWNERVERIATWRYRIEALPEVFAEFCARLEKVADASLLDRVSTDVNTRRRGRPLHIAEELLERLHLDMPRPVRMALKLGRWERRPPGSTWREIERADRDMATSIRAKAYEYGYAEWE